jgi:hypothetical protein
MNFNFNFKDMLEAAGQSIWRVTNARDVHHMGKYGIKRMIALIAGTGCCSWALSKPSRNGATIAVDECKGYCNNNAFEPPSNASDSLTC